MGAPKVTYVVASFNHQEYIGACLSSILGQAHTDLEIVVIDDGSTDETAPVLRELASQDSRISVYFQKNMGVVHARNRGMRLARGKYCSIVDSDDTLPPYRTGRLVAALDEDPTISLVFGDAWLIDRQGRPISRFFEIYPPSGDPGWIKSAVLFSTYCFIPAISVMFRRSAFEATGPFWGSAAHTDYLKWIEMGLFGKIKCLTEEPMGHWRMHDKNMSRGHGRIRAEQYEMLLEGLRCLEAKYPELTRGMGKRTVQMRFSRCRLMAGFYAGLDDDWDTARIQLAAAVSEYPSLLNLTAMVSALPLINVFSRSMYRLAARIRRIPLRASGDRRQTGLIFK